MIGIRHMIIVELRDKTIIVSNRVCNKLNVRRTKSLATKRALAPRTELYLATTTLCQDSDRTRGDGEERHDNMKREERMQVS
jgi:hypothetical protein